MHHAIRSSASAVVGLIEFAIVYALTTDVLLSGTAAVLMTAAVYYVILA